jgi:SET domain-containing protein
MLLQTTSLPQVSLEIRTTPNKGRGVFAVRRILAGELIERAPVIRVPSQQWKHVEKSVFFDYLFAWEDATGDETALALGYGSIYNHSYSPCAFYVKDYAGLTVDFIALNQIEPGDEITINYNCDPNNQDPLWFEISKD